MDETGHPEYLRGNDIASNEGDEFSTKRELDILLCKITRRGYCFSSLWVVALGEVGYT